MIEYAGNILYDRKLSERTTDMIIFGTGIYGRKILKYLQLNDRQGNIRGFCDSDEKKRGLCVEGIPVYSLDEARLRYPDAAYLIAGRYMAEMYKALWESKTKKIHLLFI